MRPDPIPAWLERRIADSGLPHWRETVRLPNGTEFEVPVFCEPTEDRTLTLSEALRIEEGLPLRWEEVAPIEEGLLNVLQLEGLTFPTRLVAGEVFLGLLARYVEAVRARSAPEVAEPQDAVGDYCRQMRESGYSRCREIAGRLVPAPGVKRQVFSLLDAAWPSKNPSRKPVSGKRLWLRWIAGLFRPGPLVSLGEMDEESMRLLETCALTVIWRKGLLGGRSEYNTGVVRRGYAMLLCSLARIAQKSNPRKREGLLSRLRDLIPDTERKVLAPTGPGPIPFDTLMHNVSLLTLYDRLSHHKHFARSMVGNG